jgi:hypothetical protein
MWAVAPPKFTTTLTNTPFINVVLGKYWMHVTDLYKQLYAGR